jgi:hypothetical protein
MRFLTAIYEMILAKWKWISSERNYIRVTKSGFYAASVVDEWNTGVEN